MYADDSVIIFELWDKLHEKLVLWKSSMEGDGRRVNMSNTKVLIFGLLLGVLQKSDKDPCAVCIKGNGKTLPAVSVVPFGPTTDAVVFVALWSPIPLFVEWCTGLSTSVAGRLMSEVTVGRERCSSTIWGGYLAPFNSDGMAMSSVVSLDTRPGGGRGRGCHKKKLFRSDPYGLPSAMLNWDPPFR